MVKKQRGRERKKGKRSSMSKLEVKGCMEPMQSQTRKLPFLQPYKRKKGWCVSMGSLSDDDDPESIQRSEGIEEKHIKKQGKLVLMWRSGAWFSNEKRIRNKETMRREREGKRPKYRYKRGYRWNQTYTHTHWLSKETNRRRKRSQISRRNDQYHFTSTWIRLRERRWGETKGRVRESGAQGNSSSTSTGQEVQNFQSNRSGRSIVVVCFGRALLAGVRVWRCWIRLSSCLRAGAVAVTRTLISAIHSLTGRVSGIGRCVWVGGRSIRVGVLPIDTLVTCTFRRGWL